MIVIGITGSPAGGKSTVAARLQELGATWINADQIARRVLEEGEIEQQLIDHFGIEITDNHGRIDRQRLARRVFGDDDARRSALNYLESVVHPETRRIILAKLQEASDQQAVAVILDVPLLFESGWDCCCDEVWCVDSPKELRQQRVAARGWSKEELERRESNQWDIKEKRRLSSFVMMNDGSLRQLTDTIDQKWSSLLSRQTQLTAHQHCRKAC